MYEDLAPKLARVLTEYSAPVQKGDLVTIDGDLDGLPLMLALYEAVVRRGGYPRLNPRIPEAAEIFMTAAADEQLDFCDPISLYIYEKIDLRYYVLAPANTKEMNTVDPARYARMQQARRPITELYFRRIGDNSLRWNISAWPTQAMAQEAEMGLLAYTDFVYKACGLDQPDPVAYWRGFQERQEKLVAWLKGKSHAEVHGPGVDLSFDFTDRPWVSCHGTVNFPDGEIFTSPIEDSVNGTVQFSYPTIYDGRKTEGVKLTFKNGRVIDASADKNEEHLLRQIDLDEGGRRLGEFAVGTNMGIQHFTGEILFDEKIGGTIHMALGEGISGVGRQEQERDPLGYAAWYARRWRDHIDGELFYRSGEFVVEK